MSGNHILRAEVGSLGSAVESTKNIGSFTTRNLKKKELDFSGPLLRR